MNINQIPSPQLTFKNFSPATGIAPGSRRLAGWTLPLTIWYFIEGRPQTEQVEGFITLVTQDQLVILTCKDRRTQHCWQHNTTNTAAQHLSPALKQLFLFMSTCVWGTYTMCICVCEARESTASPGAGVENSSKHLCGPSHHSGSLFLLSRQVSVCRPHWPGIWGAPLALPSKRWDCRYIPFTQLLLCVHTDAGG